MIQKNPYYAAATETLKSGGPPPAAARIGLMVVRPGTTNAAVEIKPEEAVDIMMKGLDKAVKG
jgi:hypothetical protein